MPIISWIHEFDEWINKYLNLTYYENQTVLKVYLKIIIFNLIRFFVHHQLFGRSARCCSLFIKIAMFQLIRQYTKAIHRHTHRNKIKSLCLNFKGRKDKKRFKNEMIMGLKIRKSCKNLEFRSGPFQLKIWSHHIWNIEISKHWKILCLLSITHFISDLLKVECLQKKNSSFKNSSITISLKTMCTNLHLGWD